MKLIDEEIIKLAMYNGLVRVEHSEYKHILAFSKALEAEWLKVDMEPV